MNNQWDVVVVGAGLAGLTAGATASAGGASTLVVEGHGPGGRARTVDRDGFIFNMGAHALYLGGPGAPVLRRLGVDPRGVKPPLERYLALRAGAVHMLPTGPSSLFQTSLLGKRSKAQFAKMMGLVPLLRPEKLTDITVEKWLEDHDLRPDVASTIGALIRLSTYTSDLSSMSADAVVVQLQIAARAGVVYLHGGWAQLIDGLSRHVEIHRNSPVAAVEPVAGRLEVHTAGGPLIAGQVVLATGTPAGARTLLPGDPGWGELGEPVSAACLDVGTARVPEPGYVLGIDEPLYGTTQSPPARHAPAGGAVVSVIRYGARSAEQDRPQLEAHLRRLGVDDNDVVTRRFLAHMVVAGASPSASSGGLRGRPGVDASGLPGVYLAGDWVGPSGLLADAALASGEAAAKAALAALEREPSRT
ncbi:MAG: FAD-dependent oxidoreductase [Acidimicrobiales bacterium]